MWSEHLSGLHISEKYTFVLLHIVQDDKVTWCISTLKPVRY